MLKNLRKLRNEAHISQKSLAEAIGVSQQSINKYENHNIEPDLRTLVIIADFFNTSVDYLIGNTDIRHKIEPINEWDLNAEEEKLVSSYRLLSKKKRHSVRLVIESILDS